MREYHLCPVCKLVRIARSEVKTCGTPECLRLWRRASISQRAQMLEEADLIQASMIAPVTPHVTHPGTPVQKFYDILEKEFGKDHPTPPPPTPNEPESHLSPTTQRDNEFLEKMFGKDAPGTVKPEKDDENKDK